MNNEPTPNAAILPTAESTPTAPEPSGAHNVFLRPGRASRRLAARHLSRFGIRPSIPDRPARPAADSRRRRSHEASSTQRGNHSAIRTHLREHRDPDRFSRRRDHQPHRKAFSRRVRPAAPMARSENYSGKEPFGDWVLNRSRCWQSLRSADIPPGDSPWLARRY